MLGATIISGDLITCDALETQPALKGLFGVDMPFK